MAKIKNAGNIICCKGYGETETLMQCWWEYKMIVTLENGLTICQMIKPKSYHDSAIPLLDIYPEEVKMNKEIKRGKNMSMQKFIAALFKK